MHLSERLQMNVSLVPKGTKVADIGCDHGYAAIWLVQNNVADKVIAMDINQGPIERAMEHVRQYNLQDEIECRKSNGTQKLIPGEVDTLMIAGMGGPLMVEILRANPEVMKQIRFLVLQPQSELDTVRAFLREIGYGIQIEKACVDEGKYYFAIQAERDTTSVEEGFGDRYGSYLIAKKDSVMRRFLEKEKTIYTTILREHPNIMESRKQELQAQIVEVEELLLQFSSDS